MGKMLIIKGADFSTVAVDKFVASILGCLDCVPGSSWIVYGRGMPSKNTNSARVSNSEKVDISSITSAYSSITLTPKSGYKFAIYIGYGGTDDNVTDWQYFTAATTFQISGRTKMCLMVAPTDTSVTQLTSNEWSTYITEELS